MNDSSTPVRVRAVQNRSMPQDAENLNPQRPAARKLSPDDILRREVSGMTPTQMNQFWHGSSEPPSPLRAPPPIAASPDWMSAVFALVFGAVGLYAGYRLMKWAGYDSWGVKEAVEKSVRETAPSTLVDGGSEYERYLAGLNELRAGK